MLAQGLAVIHVAYCELDIEQLTPVVDHDVLLKTKEPAGGAFV
jgi:hypothetical protein